MLEELVRQKAFIARSLEEGLQYFSKNSLQSSVWMKDGMERVVDYTLRGKMIRGALVDLGFRLFAAPDSHHACQDDIHRVAAAMELFQSMLLIHDDVMDQDELRRGKPSVHVQYRDLAQQKDCRQPAHLGESMAICLGDVCAFQAFEFLCGLSADPVTVRDLVRLFSRELSYVGYAQMEDVFNSSSPQEADASMIAQVYRFKTGRYTFSLPLMAGAVLAGAPVASLDGLARLGEALGIIFQIRDDHLGLFGAPDKTGKPRGSDIREDKKTLHRAYLMESLDISEAGEISRIFGNDAAGEQDLTEVLALMDGKGVLRRIHQELELYARECRELIDALPGLNASPRQELHELLAYNLGREA